MKPKSHVAVNQKRESREEKLCHTTFHDHQAQTGTKGCIVTLYNRCQPGTLRANHKFYK